MVSLSRNDSHDLEEAEATTFTQRGVVLQRAPETSPSPPITWCLAGYNVFLWPMYGI